MASRKKNNEAAADATNNEGEGNAAATTAKARKPATTKIYVVLDNESSTKRLVEAKTKAGALKHVAGTRFEVERPSDGELVGLIRKGTEIEKATGEDEAAADE